MHKWHCLLLACVAVFKPIASYSQSSTVDGPQCCDRSFSSLYRDTQRSLYETKYFDTDFGERRNGNRYIKDVSSTGDARSTTRDLDNRITSLNLRSRNIEGRRRINNEYKLGANRHVRDSRLLERYDENLNENRRLRTSRTFRDEILSIPSRLKNYSATRRNLERTRTDVTSRDSYTLSEKRSEDLLNRNRNRHTPREERRESLIRQIATNMFSNSGATRISLQRELEDPSREYQQFNRGSDRIREKFSRTRTIPYLKYFSRISSQSEHLDHIRDYRMRQNTLKPRSYGENHIFKPIIPNNNRVEISHRLYRSRDNIASLNRFVINHEIKQDTRHTKENTIIQSPLISHNTRLFDNDKNNEGRDQRRFVTERKYNFQNRRSVRNIDNRENKNVVATRTEQNRNTEKSVIPVVVANRREEHRTETRNMKENRMTSRNTPVRIIAQRNDDKRTTIKDNRVERRTIFVATNPRITNRQNTRQGDRLLSVYVIREAKRLETRESNVENASAYRSQYNVVSRDKIAHSPSDTLRRLSSMGPRGFADKSYSVFESGKNKERTSRESRSRLEIRTRYRIFSTPKDNTNHQGPLMNLQLLFYCLQALYLCILVKNMLSDAHGDKKIMGKPTWWASSKRILKAE